MTNGSEKPRDTERLRISWPVPRALLPLPSAGWLVLIICLAPFTCANDSFPSIHVDQIGYPTNGAKLAIFADLSPDRFTVIDLSDGEVVMEAELGPPAHDRLSGQTVRTADFSALSKTGTYELRVGESARSFAFEITSQPYFETMRLATRSYYAQRCGTQVDLEGEHAPYRHASCHAGEAYHPSSGREGERSSTGGWHDAGDYGRYTVNSAISVGTLLWAWELFPESFRGLDLAIPESGNAVPDLLDEIRWNLEWMLSMQDDDGGVWHKQTSQEFPGMIMPEDDDSVSFVIGTGSEPYKSSCATGGFAASMAVAARVYEPFDREFSSRTLAAARDAWSWVTEHPDITFKNPPDVSTGEYGDDQCRDQSLWAAAEIWRTTSDVKIANWLLEHADDAIRSIAPTEPPSWNEVGPMAAWTYALSGRGNREVVNSIIRRSVLAADQIVERSRSSAYRIPLVRENYVWGSNGVAANYGLQLLVTNELHPDPAYRETALEIVHYLLGRNPHSISWVTGVGDRSVQHPHHRPSVADDIDPPWPGLLAGGPNRSRQDPAMDVFPDGTPPALMYLDEQASFATNEIAINWNAALVFTIAGIAE